MTPTRGVKRDSGSAAEQQVTASTEENWSALSNLRVASESSEETVAQTPAQPRSTGSDSSRHKVRRTNSYANPSTPQDDGSFSKSSLSFILDDQAASAAAAGDDIFGDKRAAALIARSRSTGDLTGDAIAAATGRAGRAGGKQSADGKRRARRPPSRICKHEGCEQYVVDQGLCVRHGVVSTECKVPSCINRAKSRGFCWSHGGGTKCKTDNCEKIAISNGLCWAHGGGKRCAVEGCMRQAYERTDNLCNNHYQERQHGTAAVEASEEVAGPTILQLDDEEKPPAPPADQ
ncbi:WRKY transcription factor 19 [Phytophthora nicotianae]|uniref:WRKY transcription factor 19 n=1 Tax=Phytophthora nicotianae TaxID=4792 RepID=A0A0W8C8I1_PHYNI|nr:WRKY transcription factor 19 [Phytophthora nicotianae]